MSTLSTSTPVARGTARAIALAAAASNPSTTTGAASDANRDQAGTDSIGQLAERPAAARPFDQDRWLGQRPWTDSTAVEIWEAAHGHDVRLKCYPEFGCQAIDHELDDATDRLARLRALVDAAREHGGDHATLTVKQLGDVLDGWVPSNA